MPEVLTLAMGYSTALDLTLAQAQQLAEALLGLINQAAAEPAP